MTPNRFHRLKLTATSPGSMREVLKKLSQAIASQRACLDRIAEQHRQERRSQERAWVQLHQAVQKIETRLEQLEMRLKHDGSLS